jgi:FAD/FMN-containing dehydrogenase
MSDPLVKKLRKIVGAAMSSMVSSIADLRVRCLLRAPLPRAVVFVHSTEEVSQVSRLLNGEGVPLVARGTAPTWPSAPLLSRARSCCRWGA